MKTPTVVTERTTQRYFTVTTRNWAKPVHYNK
jgi:hypothetical protein